MGFLLVMMTGEFGLRFFLFLRVPVSFLNLGVSDSQVHPLLGENPFSKKHGRTFG